MFFDLATLLGPLSQPTKHSTNLDPCLDTTCTLHQTCVPLLGACLVTHSLVPLSPLGGKKLIFAGGWARQKIRRQKVLSSSPASSSFFLRRIRSHSLIRCSADRRLPGSQTARVSARPCVRQTAVLVLSTNRHAAFESRVGWTQRRSCTVLPEHKLNF